MLTFATLIDFSILAACLLRSSIFLLSDVICAEESYCEEPSHLEKKHGHYRTYLLFSTLVLLNDTGFSAQDQLKFLPQRLQLISQLIRASFMRFS